jgi:8-oxo-dGTP pyrophosphatase MutT (NUDIX family)
MLHLVDLRTRLRDALDPAPSPVAAPGDRLAAVLALLIEGPEPRLVFTERSSELSRHPGEVSFPGGLQEPQDPDLRATALRETEEEIGLPRDLPELLGALPPVHTFVSAILVVPFVAALVDPPAWVPSTGEIARVITEPLAVLEEVEREVTWTRPGGQSWTGWVYEVGDAMIWGATGRMLHDLLEILRREAAA